MKNILFGLLFIMPTVSYGAVAKIEDRPVPVSRISDAAKKDNDLYNSDFVFFLEHSVPEKNFTLGNVARACIDYTTINDKIKRENCKNFMYDIIGITHLTDLTKTFVATTTSDTKEFKFRINATGNYTVDCGDGGDIKEISISDAKTGQEITCEYSESGAYNIIIGGRATGYDNSVSAISFYGNTNLAGINGSLGAIFPTLGKSQPVFANTFYGCSDLTGTIPENLFSGISGAPAEYMFHYTFSGCSNLTGSIPENLFSGISGDPAKSMFWSTFDGCSNLTGTIPEDLFSGISGDPAVAMFSFTFYGCSGLSGDVTKKIFGNITGDVSAEDVEHWGTFYGTGIKFKQ